MNKIKGNQKQKKVKKWPPGTDSNGDPIKEIINQARKEKKCIKIQFNVAYKSVSEALVMRMGNHIFYSFTVFQTKSNRFISVCAAKRIFCTLYRFTWKLYKIRSENKQNWMESSSSKGALITLCLLKYAFQLNCAANIGSTFSLQKHQPRQFVWWWWS